MAFAVNYFDCYKYRNTKFKKGDNGSKEWVSKDTKPILYGIQNVNYDNDTLVITEGQIDSLSLTEAGIENALSVPMGKNNFNWVNTCWDFLQRFEKIIVFGDNENGKITLVDEIARMLKRHQILVVRSSDYQGMKDANHKFYTYSKIDPCLFSVMLYRMRYLSDFYLKVLQECRINDFSQLQYIHRYSLYFLHISKQHLLCW